MTAAASQQPVVGFVHRMRQKFSCCQKPDDKAAKSAEQEKLDEKLRQIQELREFFRKLGIYMLMLFCFSLSIWLDLTVMALLWMLQTCYQLFALLVSEVVTLHQ
jgi:hypothetical protein